MSTKKDSGFDKLSTYMEDALKTVRAWSKDLVPPIEETELVSLGNQIQKFYGKSSRLRHKRDYRELDHMEQKRTAALRDFRTLNKLQANKKGKESSLIWASMFLFAFEGVYTNTLNSFCLQLVINGHDLFDPIRREYASSSSEISDVDIVTKFKFLKRHNLKMLIRKEDQRLRNKIAHYDFSIDKNGNFSIDRQQVNVASKLFNLMLFEVCVGFMTTQGVKAILRKRQAKAITLKNQLKTST